MRQPSARAAVPAGADEALALSALQFASLMLARNRDGTFKEGQAIAFQPQRLLADAGRRLGGGGGGGEEQGSGDDSDGGDRARARAEAAAAAAAAPAAAGGGAEEGEAQQGQGQQEDLLLHLYRAPAEAMRRAASGAPLFSVRSDGGAAAAAAAADARGEELAADLLGGLAAGRLAVLLKCWGRGAMPAAARALARAREVMRAQGHDLVAICDLRSSAEEGRSKPGGKAKGGGGAAPQWRWRFLVASCPAEAASDDERIPYFVTGGPPGAGAAEAAAAEAQQEGQQPQEQGQDKEEAAAA